jgi:hypothetical protein
LNIPRFNDDKSDSWHFSQYLRGFATSEEMYKTLDAYASNQNSRFTFVTKDKIHTSGRGWFNRDGVLYSNVSALCNIAEEGFNKTKRLVYKGGLLTDTAVEVTSDVGYDGLHYDTERKLYTNKPIPVSTASAWPKADPKTFVDAEGHKHFLYIDKNNQWGYWDYVTKTFILHEPPVETKPDDKNQGILPLLKPKSEAEKLDMTWKRLRLEGIAMLCRAPWLRTNLGSTSTSQRSYPRADGEGAGQPFDYGNITEKNSFGNIVTYRFNNGLNTQWVEVQYSDDGNFIARNAVSGPYKGGLVIRNGQDLVLYGKTIMPMNAWREIIIGCYFPEMLSDDEETVTETDINRLEELAAGLASPRLRVTVDGKELNVELD